MQSSNIPSRIPLPFAYAAGSGYVNPIPTNSQIGINAGRASLHDGFPPLNFTPIASGGVPPFGGDMNGILNEITAIQQWQQAGGFFPYDSAFSTAVGGYPQGAIIQAANSSTPGSLGGLWISLVDNNTSNPDANGANWVPLAFSGITVLALTSTTTTITLAQSAYPIINLTGTLTANSTVIFPTYQGYWIVENNTTGAYTLTAKTASGTGVTLTQGQSTYIFCDGSSIYYADSSKVASFNGRVGAVTLNALDVTNALGYTPANISGNASQIFEVAPAVLGTQAVRRDQFPSAFVGSSGGYQVLPNGFYMQWGTFTLGTDTAGTINLYTTFPNVAAGIAITGQSGFAGSGVQNSAYPAYFVNNSQFYTWNDNLVQPCYYWAWGW
jgi:hypothetical protein